MGNHVPVDRLRRDCDHRVVHRATAERSNARIPNAAALWIVFAIELLARGVAVMVYEIIPAAPFVLAAEAVEYRSGIKEAALVSRVHQVAPRLDEENLEPVRGGVRSQCAGARAGTDDDVVCVSHVGRRPLNSRPGNSTKLVWARDVEPAASRNCRSAPSSSRVVLAK